jgi:hypothetical protein
METIDISSAADRLARARARDMAAAQEALSSQKAGIASAASAPAVEATASGRAYGAGKAIGSKLGTISKLAKVGAIASPIAGFGDYKINDSDVDSSAGGTISALAKGDFSGAGRSVQNGVLEAGLDSISGIAKTADSVAGLVGAQPNLAGKFAHSVQGRLGNQVAVNPALTAPAQQQASIISSAQAASVPTGTQTANTSAAGSPPGVISSLSNPASLNDVVGNAVNGVPGAVKLQGGMFKNPMYTDDPVRAANEYPMAGGSVQSGASTGGPISSIAGSAAPAGRSVADINANAARILAETQGTIQRLHEAQGERVSGRDKAAVQQRIAGMQQGATNATATQAAQLDLAAKEQMASLQQQILSEKDPSKRKTLYDTFLALSGKNPGQDKVVLVDADTGQKDMMGQPIFKKIALNPTTGEFIQPPAAQSAKPSLADATAQAKAAVDAGASKDAVNQRLKEFGYAPI